MWICPVCNGMNSINHYCPECSARMDDLGKLSDLYTPYSPYREIEDVKMTNGYMDHANHECMHMTLCPHCHYQQVISVKESGEMANLNEERQ